MSAQISKKSIIEIDTDDTSAVSECFELPVCQVSWMILKRACAAVAGGEGLFAVRRNVEEASFRQMGNIDDYAEIIHLFHCIKSKRLQSPGCMQESIRTVRKSDTVFIIPGQRHHPNSITEDLVETVELSDRPFYVGVQYHPEFKSRPNKPHPLFSEFIKAALS